MSQLVETKAWDLSVRIFHWLLVAAIAFCWASAEIGGNLMDWHTKSGYLVAGLVVFRILWGFFGSWTARFVNFVRHPKFVLGYVKGTENQHYVTHNPLGSYAVLGLLTLVGIQVGTGLFANDDIFIEGPFAYLISYDLSLQLTEIHQGVFNALLGLVALHVGAVIYHQRFKGEKLVQSMIHGRKQVPETEARPLVIPKIALILCLIVAAALVYWLLQIG